MEWEPHTAATIVRREGHRLIELCSQAPDAPVGSCPGWTGAELAQHTASVYRRVAHWCSVRAREPEPWPEPEPADPSTPWAWCDASVDLVADAIESVAPDEPVWSWTDRQNGAFYHRRMVHETVLHRWDAGTLAGEPAPLDPMTSADGIDELMSVGMRFRSAGTPITYPLGSVAVMSVDTGHRWSLVAVDGVLGIGRGETVITGTDATITGDAADILLALWGRPGGPLERRGNTAIADAWCAIAP